MSNGNVVRTRASGDRSDFHDASRNMDIHHGLNGNRRISVERADHSRVFAQRGGPGYVHHPYMYRGHEFGRRTYYYQGRYYDRYYNHYYYHGVYVQVYAPAYYYPPAYYGWVYNPWPAPVVYPWGWAGNPWYAYYGGFFTPYPVYASASLWLTDYIIAASLAAAYQAQVDEQIAAASAPQVTPLTPEAKQMIADEVQRQVALENAEAQQNAQNQDIDPQSSSIARMLDGTPHAFVAGGDMDLVDTAGQECAISQGDVLVVSTAPAADATSVNAVVMASKGGKECAKSDNVSVAISDLQEMQNHMRDTIDQGLGDLKAKQGKNGIPAAPPSAQGNTVQAASVSAAPPSDPNAGAEIKAQLDQADQAEKEVASVAPPPAPGAESASASPSAAPSTAAPTTISVGQTVDEIKASLGNPTKIIDLGSKQIYVYQDMKITFKGGKVSDVQ